MKSEIRFFFGLVILFLLAYFLPIANPAVQEALLDALRMLQWYARCHTLACVIPAMFIAGAISSFLSKEAVLKHLGPKAGKVKAYAFASVSGTILAVCSCSVLPMFAGIYRVGAGLGPASAFLCSGPALNVMAIFLTARILGFELGAARTVTAILMSLVIGIMMALIFRRSEQERTVTIMQMPDPVPTSRKSWQTGLFLAAMIAFLVFSDWVNPASKVLTLGKGNAITHLDHAAGNFSFVLPEDIELETSVTQLTGDEMKFQVQRFLSTGVSIPEREREMLQPGNHFLIRKDCIAAEKDRTPENYRWSAAVYEMRWMICLFIGLAILAMAVRWFSRDEISEWMGQTWSFAKTIVPLLFGGIFVTGFAASLVPADSVARWLGGNTLLSNFMASIAGTLWYFATLTEIPLLQALTGLGMGKGPALALLLAGPTLSLPSIIVVGRYLGAKKTAVFVGLTVFLSTVIGFLYGMLF